MLVAVQMEDTGQRFGVFFYPCFQGLCLVRQRAGSGLSICVALGTVSVWGAAYLGQRCESDHRPLSDRLAAGPSSRRKSRTFHVGNFLIASVLQGRRGAAPCLGVDFAINTACYRVQAAIGRPSFPPIAVQTFDAGLPTAAGRLLSLTSHGSSCFQQRRMFTLGMPGCPFINATADKPEKLCRIFGLKGPTRLCRCRAYAVSQSPI